jgi:hypothetical protein
MKLRARLFCLSIFSLPVFVHAAACCGGGLAAPALIAGDERAQMTGSFTSGNIQSDVGDDGLWHRRPGPETIEDYRLEGAHLLSDLWQAGASVPIVRRSRDGRNSTGFGDINGTLGYEYLPDWDYNPWRPKGLGYLQLTVPAGRSVYESTDDLQLDARGRGFWAAGAGTLLSKVIGRFDVFGSTEAHRSFSRTYANSQSSGRLSPGWGVTWGGGAGLNYGDWRFSGSLLWTYEDPVSVSGTVESHGSAQRYATSAISVSRMFGMTWSGTLTYSDQTWFGSPSNTSLSRSLILVVQKRWLR